MPAFARFAWIVLAVNVVVVAWGGFVRATGSGAGCGSHWPTCNGEVVPRPASVEMAIELTHRLTSGAALVLVAVLAVWAFRAFPRGHAARRGAATSMVLIVVEALVGAALVLFGWVVRDASAARALAMPIHLSNTFLLLGALALTAWWGAPRGEPVARAPLPPLVLAALAATMLAGITGAIAALGDTLFPATSFADGLRQELAKEAHALVRLRVVHPFVAVVAAACAVLAARAAARDQAFGPVRRAADALTALVVAQVAVGVTAVALLAPVWAQILHLVLADATWIALVLLAAAARERGATAAAVARPATA
jgi:cytochrome c oxidase assembly protein subunit 15